jgi:hypothetical protein
MPALSDELADIKARLDSIEQRLVASEVRQRGMISDIDDRLAALEIDTIATAAGGDPSVLYGDPGERLYYFVRVPTVRQ